MNEYFVYMLRCSDGSYYTGVTNDYRMRVSQHQEGLDRNCYTFKRRPVELVYLATFCDIRDAIAWEKHLKRWSRTKKEALACGEYVKLGRLAECRNSSHCRNKHSVIPRLRSG
ncbi:TPA: hypothetical protein DCL30_03405 [Candidatus Peribacteria bacterium]|nr:hypothetical protein [Candidatus Peribacteria bacterium]HAS34270.1 hypothetical protein [Candidatus Peribacteria bacterium]